MPDDTWRWSTKRGTMNTDETRSPAMAGTQPTAPAITPKTIALTACPECGAPVQAIAEYADPEYTDRSPSHRYIPPVTDEPRRAILKAASAVMRSVNARSRRAQIKNARQAMGELELALRQLPATI